MAISHIYPLPGYADYAALYRIDSPDGTKNLHVSSDFMEDEDPQNIASLFDRRNLRGQLALCGATEALLIGNQVWRRGPLPKWVRPSQFQA